VMVHGTTGIGVVNELYREPILNAGIAIFEVDFRTGIYHGPMDRPHIDTFLPLAFAALKELRKSPGIDPNRIGIMGFSMGGAVVLRTAVESYRQQWMGNEKGFATFVAFYPVTKPFIPILENSGSTLMGPMIIFYGTNDSYGEGKAVPEFKKLLEKKYHYDLTTVEYAGATHDFNRNEPPRSYADPAAIGGKGYMEWNPEAANDSLTKVVAYLRQTLEVK
jgi:dienelactone hydrolase